MTGRAYAVAGGKGGVGKTTTVVNLGVMLRVAGHRVAVVDADLGMANVATVLGIDHEPTLHDVLAGDSTVGEAVIEEPDGFGVVPGSPSLDGFAAADPEGLEDVIDYLVTDYDFVLVDTGAGLSFESVLPVGMTDGVVLVTTLDQAAIEDTAKTAEIVELADGTVLGAVLTRVRDEVDIESVADELDTDILGVIPEDPAVQDSIDDQKPLITLDSDAPAATAYRELGTVLLDRSEAKTGVETEIEAEAVDRDETTDTDAESNINADEAVDVPDLDGDSEGGTDSESESGSGSAGDTDDRGEEGEDEVGPGETAEHADGDVGDQLDSEALATKDGRAGTTDTTTSTDGIDDERGDVTSSDDDAVLDDASAASDEPGPEEPVNDDLLGGLSEGSIGTGADSDDGDDFLEDEDPTDAEDYTSDGDADALTDDPPNDPSSEASGPSTEAATSGRDTDLDVDLDSPDPDANDETDTEAGTEVTFESDADELAEPTAAVRAGETDVPTNSSDVESLDDGSDADTETETNPDSGAIDGDFDDDGSDEPIPMDDGNAVAPGRPTTEVDDVVDAARGAESIVDEIEVDEAEGHTGDGADHQETASDSLEESSVAETEEETLAAADSADSEPVEDDKSDTGDDIDADESEVIDESESTEGGISIPEAPSEDDAAVDEEEAPEEESSRSILSRLLNPFG